MRKPVLHALLITSALGAPIFAPSPADAAIADRLRPASEPVALRLDERKAVMRSVSLDVATGQPDVLTLDANRPSGDLTFDLSDADVTDQLSVTLSADPLPGADAGRPLIVQFNSAAPVRIETRGRGFDTTIRLDERYARGQGNRLSIRYNVPCGDTGGYRLSLDESRLSLRTRPKARKLQLHELKSRLSRSAFAPRSVGLVASGPETARLQLLGAQAIGLRMAELPDFSVGDAGDFDLIMLPRSELYRYTTDADILGSSGPRIAFDRRSHDRIFLTGDTQAEVLQSVQAFARAELPQSYRSMTSPGEVTMQRPLDFDRTYIDRKAKLSALAVKTGTERVFDFSVSDPRAASGKLILSLTRDDQTVAGAGLRAMLNGEDLGTVTMDSRRKSATYPIQPGRFRAGTNRLVLTTLPSETQGCDMSEPFIAIGKASRLSVETRMPTPATDLSRLASNSSVFGVERGAHTALFLPRSQADFEAALSVAAKLAAVTGEGWAEASVTRGQGYTTRRYQLILQPSENLSDMILADAPRAFQAAITGGPTETEQPELSVQRFASLNSSDMVRMASAQQRAVNARGTGGVASVFETDDRQIVGILTNMPGQSFPAAMAPLLDDDHWNQIQGGVSRWNDETVAMVQAHAPTTQAKPKTTPSPRPNWRDAIGTNPLDPASFDWPLLPDLSGMSDTAKTGWSRLVGRFEKTEAVERPAIPAPRLKPRQADKDVAIAARLRGSVQPSSDRASQRLSMQRVRQQFQDTKRNAHRWILKVESKASALRADLRQRSGLRSPNVRSLRFGGTEISPGILALLMAFLAAIIGLAFIAPSARTGDHH